MSTIGEFVATLGIVINTTQWNAADEKLKSFSKNFLGLKTKIAGSVEALALFENSIGRSLTKMGNMSQILQMPVGQIQALKLAANEAQVPLESVMGTIGSLQSSLASIKVGFMPDNLRLGLSSLAAQSHESVIIPNSAMSGFDLFKKIVTQLQKVQGTQAKEGVLGLLGIDPSILPLISNGLGGINKAYAELKERGDLFDPKQVAQAKQFNQQLSLMKIGFENTVTILGIKLMPIFQQLYQEFNNLTKDKNFLNGLEAIGEALGAIAYILAKIISLIGVLAKVSLNVGSPNFISDYKDSKSARLTVGGAFNWLKGDLGNVGVNTMAENANYANSSFNVHPIEAIGNWLKRDYNNIGSGMPQSQNATTNNNSTTATTNNSRTTNNYIYTQSGSSMISPHITGGFR